MIGSAEPRCAYHRKYDHPDRKPLRFSPRDLEVLGCLAKGMETDEIGSLLGISKGTVGTYTSRLLLVTKLKSRLQLGLWAYRNLSSGVRYSDKPGALTGPEGAD